MAAQVALDLKGLTDANRTVSPVFCAPKNRISISFFSSIRQREFFSATPRLRRSCSGSATGGWQLNPEQTTATDLPSLTAGN
jgi:hypothetical protein